MPKREISRLDRRLFRRSSTRYRRGYLAISGRKMEEDLTGGEDQKSAKHRLLGLGSAGVDFIAVVDRCERFK